MYSFYGGKQGRTYHIVLRFDCVNINNFDTDFADILIKSDDTVTQDNPDGKFKIENLTISALVKNVTNQKYYRIIQQPNSLSDVFNSQYAIELLLKGMVQLFRKGGNYTDVNYGLYVIIDTVKNLGQHTNDENGLLFRRGFDYLENGTTKPNKSNYYLTNNITHTNTFKKNEWQRDWSNWIENVGGGAIYVGQIVGPIGKTGLLDAVTWDELGLSEDLAIELNLTRAGASLLEGLPHFLDDILFGVAQIKGANGDITGHKISFDFIKPVINIQAKDASPYGTQNISFIDPVTGNTDTQQIIFLNSGNTNSDLIKEHSSSENHPFYYSYQIAIPHGRHGDSIDSLAIKENINDNSYSYLTYKLKKYNVNPDGLLTNDIFISPYNVIKSIKETSEEERTFIKIDTRSTRTRSEVQLGSLARYEDENIEDEENTSWSTNKFLVCTSLGSRENIYIPTIDDGEPSLGQVFKDSSYPDLSAVWECIELPIVAEQAKITIEFTAAPDQTLTIRNISYLYMDQYGNLYIKYSDIPNSEPIKLGHIPILKYITFNNFESSGNSRFYQTISTENGFNSTEIPGGEINYPVDIRREGDVMYVLYSSETYRNNIQNNYKVFNYNNQPYKYKAFPLAPIGYHILGNVPLEALVENGTFANGVLEYTITVDGSTFQPFEQNAGWVVSVQTEQSENNTVTTLYAYDYTLSSPNHRIIVNGEEKNSYWYPIETRETGIDLTSYYIVDRLSDNSTLNNPIPNDTTASGNLKTNGIWFVLE